MKNNLPNQFCEHRVCKLFWSDNIRGQFDNGRHTRQSSEERLFIFGSDFVYLSHSFVHLLRQDYLRRHCQQAFAFAVAPSSRTSRNPRTFNYGHQQRDASIIRTKCPTPRVLGGHGRCPFVSSALYELASHSMRISRHLNPRNVKRILELERIKIKFVFLSDM